MNSNPIRPSLLAALLVLVPLGVEAQKIKDIARVEGVRTQQLKGIGLVMGLSGSGDSARNDLTRKLYLGYLENLGIDMEAGEIRSKNVAAVTVTATISSWTQAGSKIEVVVASAGDAKSLAGGYLVETYLYRPSRSAEDDPLLDPVAVAQGRIEASGSTLTMGKTQATLEGDVSFPILSDQLQSFRIVLDKPDFSTASYIARAINEFPYFRAVAKDELPLAHADRLGSILVKVPARFREREQVIDLISRVMSDVPVEDLDPEARVVIDKETKAISINGKVRVTPVVVIYHNLRIAIGIDQEESVDGQPARDRVDFRPRVMLLSQVMRDLEQQGIEPADLPAVIRLIHDAGSLIGQLVER